MASFSALAFARALAFAKAFDFVDNELF